MIEKSTPIARAIAVRSVNEQQRAQRRFAESLGQPSQPVNPLIQEAMIVGNTRLIDKLLTEPNTLPTSPLALVENIFENLSEEVFEELIRDVEKAESELSPITASQLRSLVRLTLDAVVTAMVPTTSVIKAFEKTIAQANIAKQLGAEKGLEPEKVYEDEELYSELIRRSQTPRVLARSAINGARQFTASKMGDVVMNMIPGFVEAVYESEREYSLISQDEIQEMRQEVMEDPEFQELVRTSTLQYKRSILTHASEEILRFWGQEGLDSLPKTVRATLLPK